MQGFHVCHMLPYYLAFFWTSKCRENLHNYWITPMLMRTTFASWNLTIRKTPIGHEDDITPGKHIAPRPDWLAL